MRVYSVENIPRELLESRSRPASFPDILSVLAHLRSPMPKGHSTSRGAASRAGAFKEARRQSLERCRSLIRADRIRLCAINSDLDKDEIQLRAINEATEVAALESAWVILLIAARKAALNQGVPS